MEMSTQTTTTGTTVTVGSRSVKPTRPSLRTSRAIAGTVSNLFIDRDTEDDVGLFGAVDSSRISGVTLAGADVSGRDAVGSLLGDGVYGSIVDNHATRTSVWPG